MSYFKRKILKSLNYIIKKLSQLKLKLTINDNPNPYFFEDLTPTCRGDRDKKYSETIEWALKNENILNIALTGTYGSGKSSIIQTFINEHPEYETLNISLASFKDEDTKEDHTNRLLELSILQQMFYHVKYKEIPDSRFKRIKSISTWQLSTRTLFFLIWLLSTLICCNSKFILNTEIWKKLSENLVFYISTGALIIFFIGVAFLFSKLLRIFNNYKINKFKIQSCSIEIDPQIDSSILNKHLDEILYFFEVTKFELVIFEDLDRFNNTEIFTKLRELNILINHSRQINRQIKFLYCIKDDIFQDRNRTKFFDFLIPIIPVVNSSNSREILLEKFKKNNLIQEHGRSILSPEFISDISIYIEDMRLLKNIYNEYMIYKEKLDPKLNQNNLLAMIVYKNIFPSDFIELHKGAGKVYNIFLHKKDIIQNHINIIDQKIQDFNDQIFTIKNESITNVQELRAIYLEAIIENIPEPVQKLMPNKESHRLKDCKQDKVFSLFLKNHEIMYMNNNNNIKPANFKFIDIEKIVDPTRSYSEREKNILERNTNMIKYLQDQISFLINEKQEFKILSLYQIASKLNTNSLFEELTDKELIIYLLRNGYINENYHDYISYFYEGYITKNDRDFLLNIKNKNSIDYQNLKITKISNILKQIRIKEFENPEVLNYNLLDFLLEKQNEYQHQLKKFIDQLTNESKQSLDFIDCFISRGSHIKLFTTELFSKWQFALRYIISDSNFTNEKKDQYLHLLLEHTEVDSIIYMRDFNLLEEYLANKHNFIDFISDIDATKIQTLIKNQNIKFTNLEDTNNYTSLHEYIYRNNLYAINEHMITFFITRNHKEMHNTSTPIHTTYTRIYNSNYEEMKLYIYNNIGAYIKNVFLKLPYHTESEEAICTLLNHKEVTIEDIIGIIRMSDVKIKSLNKVTNRAVITHLLQEEKVIPNWTNILVIYYSFLSNSTILPVIKFLNNPKFYNTLAYIKIKHEISEQSEQFDILENLIMNNNLSDDAFKNLIPCFSDISFESFYLLDDLPSQKIKLMIKYKVIDLSVKAFNHLKTKFHPLHINLLLTHWKKFIASKDSYKLDPNDIVIIHELINSSKNPNQYIDFLITLNQFINK